MIELDLSHAYTKPGERPVNPRPALLLTAGVALIFVLVYGVTRGLHVLALVLCLTLLPLIIIGLMLSLLERVRQRPTNVLIARQSAANGRAGLPTLPRAR